MPPLRKEGKIRKYICYLHNCTKRNLGKVTRKLVRLVISRDGGKLGEKNRMVDTG